MDKPWDLTIPPPRYAATDEEAQQLLQYLRYRLHAYPDEPYGFDTETHGLALPFKIGTTKVLDWMNERSIMDFMDVARIIKIYYSRPEDLLNAI